MEDFENNEITEEIDDGIVTMYDENGNAVDFEYLDVIEYEGNEYATLLPMDIEEGEEDTLVILKIEPIPGNDKEENYVSIDDPDILNAVYELFKEKHAEDYDFE